MYHRTINKISFNLLIKLHLNKWLHKLREITELNYFTDIPNKMNLFVLIFILFNTLIPFNWYMFKSTLNPAKVTFHTTSNRPRMARYMNHTEEIWPIKMWEQNEKAATPISEYPNGITIKSISKCHHGDLYKKGNTMYVIYNLIKNIMSQKDLLGKLWGSKYLRV